MKCILHIGTEKTGTTAIQDFLLQNKNILKKNKIEICTNKTQFNSRLFVSYFQQKLDSWHFRNQISSLKTKKKFEEKFIENFDEYIKSFDEDTNVLIISSEYFHSRLTNRIALKTLNDFIRSYFDRIYVICYFREQSEMWQSLYSTALKQDFTGALIDFQKNLSINNTYYNHFRSANLWVEEFSAANCKLKIYKNYLFENGDIREDFVSFLDLGADKGQLQYDAQVANSSLNFYQKEIFREINKKYPFWDRKNRKINSENIKLKKLVRNLTFPYIEEQEEPRLKEIRSTFGKSNRRLFDTYFEGINYFDVEKLER